MQADNTVRAVVFDYKAIFRPGTTTPHEGVAELLRWLDEQGVLWVLLTTDPVDFTAACTASGLPSPALHLAQEDIPGRPNRGSPLWLETAAQRLGLRMNQMVIVGTTQMDWRTGINAGVVYFHARWANAISPGQKITCLRATDPGGIQDLLESFLLREPEWFFSLDEGRFHIRSLFPPEARFPASSQSPFRLHDIFTYGKTVKVGNADARNILMLQLLFSAYLDGTFPGRTWLCVYPSSTAGKISPQIAEYMDTAKVLVGSYFKEDLLERVTHSIDTSVARASGRHHEVSLATQTTTVRVNPKYRGKLSGKSVIVFDDFTTEGTSLEWARILLTAAGATGVIGLTIGKYRKPHTFYHPRAGTAIDPYATNDVTAADFEAKTAAARATGTGPQQWLAQVMQETIDHHEQSGGQ